MTPVCRPQPAPDLHDQWRGNAVAFRQDFAALNRRPNFGPLNIAKFRRRISLTEMRSSVAQTISRVLGGGRPSQISGPIIVRASIIVRDMGVSITRWRAKESLGHQTVDIGAMANAPDDYSHIAVTATVSPSRADRTINQAHLAQVRNQIQWGARNGLPNLHSTNIAHEWVNCNGGWA